MLQNGLNLKPNRVFKNEPLDDGRWMPHGQPHGNAKVAQKVLAIKSKSKQKEVGTGLVFEDRGMLLQVPLVLQSLEGRGMLTLLFLQ